MRLDALFSGVWAMRETELTACLQWARKWTDTTEPLYPRAAIGHVANRAGAVAVLPISGPISQKESLFSRIFGGTSTEGLISSFQGAMDDPNVKAIVLDINSPGGVVYGVEEAADTIRSARGKKPIISIANSLAASAAYWLGAQADEIYVAPGAEVGSVGVYMMHVDVSKALEEEGVKVEFIQAGKHKTDGNMFSPLGDEARAHFQASVNESYNAFVGALAAGRNTQASKVRSDFGEGRVFGGKEAISRGMADKVGTLSDVLKRLGVGRAPEKSGRRADTMRRKLELKKIKFQN